ncbi:MAG: hypothetical protein U0798_00880 [Gemmataceae bacterium]
MADSLIPCPRCQTTLRVPDEFRGRIVTCLECKTALLATPISEPPALSIVPPAAARGGFPPRVFIAMSSLILLGVAGMFVNGYYAVQFRNDPQALERYADSTLAQMLSIEMFGSQKDESKEKWDPDATKQRAQEWVAEHGERMKMLAFVFMGVSALVVLGGLSFAFRKPYWLGWIGCVASIANLNHGCCFPGFVAGVWGMVVLFSNEGRSYFGLDQPAANAKP